MKKQYTFILISSNCCYLLIFLRNIVFNDCKCTNGEAFLKLNNCTTDCNETELFQDKNCLPISKKEEDINNMYNKIVSYYKDININMIENIIVIEGKGINYIITTNLIENSNSNSYLLNLEGNCVNRINEKTTNYYIILINIINTDYISNTNGIRIFNNNNEKFLLSELCEKQIISIGIPIEVTTDEITLFKKIKNEYDYEIFNMYDPFYTDKCTKFTSEYNTDLILQKRNHIYGTYIKEVCSDFCIYQKFVENEQKIYCQCKLGEVQVEKNEIENERFNFKVIKCINKIVKDINKNYMFFIMSILCLLFIICLIISCIQLTSTINDFVEDFDSLKINFLNCYKLEEKKRIEEELKRKEEIEKEKNEKTINEDEDEEEEESDESDETNDNINNINNNINQQNFNEVNNQNINSFINNQNCEINPYLQYQLYHMQMYNQYLDYLKNINNKNEKREEELEEKEEGKKNDKKIKFKWLDGDNKFILKLDKNKIIELANKQKERKEKNNKNIYKEELEEGEKGKDVKFKWLEGNNIFTLNLDYNKIKELAKKQKEKEEKSNKNKYKKTIKKKNKVESIRINKKDDQKEVLNKKFIKKEDKSKLKLEKIDKNNNIEIFRKKGKKSNIIFKEDNKDKNNDLESKSDYKEKKENSEDESDGDDVTEEEESKEERKNGKEANNNIIKNKNQINNKNKEKKKRILRLNLNGNGEKSSQSKIINNNSVNNFVDKLTIQEQNSNLSKLENNEKLKIKFGSDEFYEMLNLIPEEEREKFYKISELNHMEYKHTCNYDTRNFLSIYFSMVKEENDLIYSFSFCASDYNLPIVKFSFFIVQLILYLTVSAIFFTDDTIDNFFEKKNQFNIGYMLKPILLIFLICLFICILLKTLAKINNNVIDIKYEIQTYEESLNVIRLKLILFFLFSIIISAFGWILISTWSSVFTNSQIQLVKCAGFAFTFHFILQMFYCVIITSLRICSLNSENKKFEFLYIFSEILTYF